MCSNNDNVYKDFRYLDSNHILPQPRSTEICIFTKRKSILPTYKIVSGTKLSEIIFDPTWHEINRFKVDKKE